MILDPVRMELDSEEEDDIEPAPLRDVAEDARKRREKDDELTKMMEMSDDEGMFCACQPSLASSKSWQISNPSPRGE